MNSPGGRNSDEQDEKAERSNAVMVDSNEGGKTVTGSAKTKKSSSAPLPDFVLEVHENDGECFILARPDLCFGCCASFLSLTILILLLLDV